MPSYRLCRCPGSRGTWFSIRVPTPHLDFVLVYSDPMTPVQLTSWDLAMDRRTTLQSHVALSSVFELLLMAVCGPNSTVQW
jgi:hypothetical protein